MKIVDLRENTKSYQVKGALEKAIPLIPKELITGVRNIVLLDKDHYGKRNAGGRYVNIKGTNKSDIEMYFEHYEEIPKEIINNKVFLGLLTLNTLFHELYHHLIRFHKKKMKPKFEMEQRQADNYAGQQVRKIVMEIFPVNTNRDEYDQMKAMARKVNNFTEV